MRRRSKTRSEYLSSLEYNIRDAKEALRNAVSMGKWDNVIKYANQLKALDRKLYDAETERPGRSKSRQASHLHRRLTRASHSLSSRDRSRLTPEDARRILHGGHIPEGGDSDYFTLSSSSVAYLVEQARKHGYRKSKNAPGSTARMFHKYLQRLAARKGTSRDVNAAKIKTALAYVHANEKREGRDEAAKYAARMHRLNEAEKKILFDALHVRH